MSLDTVERQSLIFSTNSASALVAGPEERRVRMMRLQHPILRSLSASHDDIAARQRCVNLLVSTVHDMSIMEFANDPDRVSDSMAGPTDTSEFTKDLFSNKPSPASDSSSPFSTLKRGQEKYTMLSRSAVQRKLSDQSVMLQNLMNASDGASCKVFWDLWDEIFVVLAESVHLVNLTEAHKGRMFTPNNDAASYIESAAAQRLAKYHCSPYGLEDVLASRADSIASSVFSQQVDPVSPPTVYSSYTPSSYASGVHDAIGFRTFDFDSDHGGRKDLRQQILALDDSSLLPRFENEM